MLLDFSSIRFGILLLATIAPFLLGFFWYGPLFGGRWMKETGLHDKDIRRSPITTIFLTSMVAMFVTAFFLSVVIQGLSVNFGWTEAVSTAFLLGVGFAATTLAINYQYARKSWQLLFIDAGYIVASYTLIGLVFGWLA